MNNLVRTTRDWVRPPCTEPLIDRLDLAGVVAAAASKAVHLELRLTDWSTLNVAVVWIAGRDDVVAVFNRHGVSTINALHPILAFTSTAAGKTSVQGYTVPVERIISATLTDRRTVTSELPDLSLGFTTDMPTTAPPLDAA